MTEKNLAREAVYVVSRDGPFTTYVVRKKGGYVVAGGMSELSAKALAYNLNRELTESIDAALEEAGLKEIQIHQEAIDAALEEAAKKVEKGGTSVSGYQQQWARTAGEWVRSLKSTP